MNLFFLFLLVPGPRVFHSDDVHCGSDGHNTRVDVNGGCLAFALPVMKHDVGPPGSQKSGTPQRIRHSICRRTDSEREKSDGERNTGKRERRCFQF